MESAVYSWELYSCATRTDQHPIEEMCPPQQRPEPSLGLAAHSE